MWSACRQMGERASSQCLWINTSERLRVFGSVYADEDFSVLLSSASPSFSSSMTVIEQRHKG